MSQTLATNLFAAAVAGAVLRLARLENQAIVGDEWHALRAAARSGAFDLLTSVEKGAHYSVPEALYFHLLTGLLEVSEAGVLVPYALVGIAAILIVPMTLARRVPGALTILPWAIALAPTFVLYSRFARPYGAIALLAVLSIATFCDWEETRRPRHLVLYTCLASLAVWFHIVSLPFVFTPLAAHTVRVLWRREDLIGTIRRAGLCLTPVGILVGIPLLRSPAAVTEKIGEARYTPSSVLDGLAVTIMSPETLVVVPTLFLCGWGIVELRRRDASRPLLVHCALACAIQLGAIVLLKPVAGEAPHIFARYAIPVSMCALVLASAGLHRITSYLKSTSLKALSIGVACLALFASTVLGPSVPLHTQVNLSLFAYLIYGSDWRTTVADGFPSKKESVYTTIGELPPGTLTILEIPYKAEDYFLPTRPLVHGQHVVYGFVDNLCSTAAHGTLDLGAALERLSLERTIRVHGVPSASRIDLAILHRDISSETSYPPQFGPYDLGPCVEMFRKELGPPVIDDDTLVVFALSEAGSRSLARVSRQELSSDK